MLQLLGDRLRSLPTALWWVDQADYLISIFSADNVTIYFLKDILSRQKAYLHNDNVKNIHIPQYKNLTVEKIMQFVS